MTPLSKLKLYSARDVVKVLYNGRLYTGEVSENTAGTQTFEKDGNVITVFEHFRMSGKAI
jgi:hypothetical protein